MKLNELNEAVIKTVSFSEISEFDNWDPKFWIGMSDYIEQYKNKGKDEATKFIAAKVKKIGEDNYKTLKNIADKNLFSVPEFKIASSASQLQTYGAEKLVILLDLIQHKAKIRKSELEKKVEELQKQIKALEE